jgi:hypothetical protein
MQKNARAVGSVENIVRRLARWSNMKNVRLNRETPLEKCLSQLASERRFSWPENIG